MSNPDSDVPQAAHGTAPRVSILIVNWNTRALLPACLDSVQNTVRDLPYDIWLIDNASTDGSAEMVRSAYPNVHLIVNPANVGFATANNQGLAQCAGEYALLLNSDAQLKPQTLARLVRVLDTEPRAAAVAPKLLNADGSFQAGPNDDITLWNETLLTLGLARLFRSGFYPGYPAHAPRGAYAWVGGTCLLMRRAAWAQIGALDPAYFMYTEEADWCWRARQAGWNVWYEPQAETLHLGGGSSRRASAKMRAALYQSKLIFFEKHRPRWQTVLLRNLVMLSASAKASAYTLAAQVDALRAPGWRERATGFRMVIDAVRPSPNER